ncbi:hypothetical protein [Thiomicrorhabdus chilensis]|uniref:hypothetical protein n=1 Tax=Thiomicrorhabdus chilensis TaxID=63656 RepID=UPI000418DA5B|nr:hypothetical protein [Thiomicrorhabdus chilensis]
MYQHPGKRPVFLSLWKFRFPLNAWLSAAHRLTGLILFISLIGYLALFNLLVFHERVSLADLQQHCIIHCLNSIFWISLSYHWLSGLRHLLAEHFADHPLYSTINHHKVSVALLLIWGLASLFIIKQAWSL